jgi:YndJ-like protein
MSKESRGLTRWNGISTALGGIAWAAVLLLRLFGAVTLDDLALFLLLAVLVIVPLVIPLASSLYADPTAGDLSRIAILVQPLAAFFGSLALFAELGSAVAAVAAIIWPLYTALLGVLGLAGIARMLLERRVQLADVSLALALVYLPIGGLWFALARMDIRPLGFSQTTVLLTAVHFHFITLAALVITGCTGRALRTIQRAIVRTSYRVAAVGMLVCPLLVAAGITLTQLSGLRALESTAAVLLALSLILIAILSLRFVVPMTASLLARLLLAISWIAVLLTMALAAAYVVGRATAVWTITVAQMVATHGWLNALAFGLCGLLGWRLKLAQAS